MKTQQYFYSFNFLVYNSVRYVTLCQIHSYRLLLLHHERNKIVYIVQFIGYKTGYY